MNKNIPDQIKEFAKSAELYDSSEKIGAIFGLHIDQIDELDSEIRSILLGVNESSDFTNHIQERLEINHDQAVKITEEANKEVFQKLKDNLMNDSNNKEIGKIEASGNFEIVKNNINGDKENQNVNYESAEYGNRSKILSDLENPSGKDEAKIGAGEMKEPLPDHLLELSNEKNDTNVIVEAPINLPVEESSFDNKIIKNDVKQVVVEENIKDFSEKKPEIPKKEPEMTQKTKKSSSDPYREAII